MESKKIYEESYNEIIRANKQMVTGSITVNLEKLDENTKNEFVTAVQDVFSKRRKEIEKVILGAE